MLPFLPLPTFILWKPNPSFLPYQGPELACQAAFQSLRRRKTAQ